jgi:hypothetical protein
MGGSILKGDNFLKNVNTGSEVNPSSYSVGTRLLSAGHRSRAIRLSGAKVNLLAPEFYI